MGGDRQFTLRQLVRYAAQGAAMTAVIAVILVLCTVSSESWDQVRAFPVRLLAALPFMVAVSWLCNGGRVWLLTRSLGHRLSYRQALAVSMSQEFGIAATPGGLGGTALRLTLLRRAGVPLSQATTMLGADVFLDSLFFALITLGAGIAVALSPSWRALLGGAFTLSPRRAALGLGLLAALVLAAWVVRRLWRGAVGALAGTRHGRRLRLGARLRLAEARLKSGVRHAWHAAGVLFGGRKMYLAGDFALTAVQWSCRYGVLPLLLLGCGTDLNPLPVMILQGLLFMTSLVLVVPGGGGGIELLSVFILPALVPTAVVGMVVLLWRFCTYHLYLVAGGLVFFWTVHHIERVFPAEEAKAATDVATFATPE